MSKPPSDKTLLKNERAEHRRTKDELARVKVELQGYRSRATKAEQECAEWKARFDVLLRRDEPRVEISGDPFKPITAPIIG